MEEVLLLTINRAGSWRAPSSSMPLYMLPFDFLALFGSGVTGTIFLHPVFSPRSLPVHPLSTTGCLTVAIIRWIRRFMYQKATHFSSSAHLLYLGDIKRSEWIPSTVYSLNFFLTFQEKDGNFWAMACLLSQSQNFKLVCSSSEKANSMYRIFMHGVEKVHRTFSPTPVILGCRGLQWNWWATDSGWTKGSPT